MLRLIFIAGLRFFWVLPCVSVYIAGSQVLCLGQVGKGLIDPPQSFRMTFRKTIRMTVGMRAGKTIRMTARKTIR